MKFNIDERPSSSLVKFPQFSPIDVSELPILHDVRLRSFEHLGRTVRPSRYRRARRAGRAAVLDPMAVLAASASLHHRSSRKPLKNGCRTLPSADFARYLVSASEQLWLHADALVRNALGVFFLRDALLKPKSTFPA